MEAAAVVTPVEAVVAIVTAVAVVDADYGDVADTVIRTETVVIL